MMVGLLVWRLRMGLLATFATLEGETEDFF